MPRNNVERKKNPRVVNVLKESGGTTTIIKRILDLGVNFTIGELFASATAVEKQLTKAISEDEAVQFRVNALSSTEALEAANPYSTLWDHLRQKSTLKMVLRLRTPEYWCRNKCDDRELIRDAN